MKVDINLPIHPEHTSIKINGEEVKRVTALKVEAGVGNVPVLELKFIPEEINITGDLDVLRDKGLEHYSIEELSREIFERMTEEKVNSAFKVNDKS